MSSVVAGAQVSRASTGAVVDRSGNPKKGIVVTGEEVSGQEDDSRTVHLSDRLCSPESGRSPASQGMVVWLPPGCYSVVE